MAMFGGSGVAVGMGAGEADDDGLGAGLRAALAGPGENAAAVHTAARSEATNRIRFKIVCPYRNLGY